jgi:hypothetical protein
MKCALIEKTKAKTHLIALTSLLPSQTGENFSTHWRVSAGTSWSCDCSEDGVTHKYRKTHFSSTFPEGAHPKARPYNLRGGGGGPYSCVFPLLAGFYLAGAQLLYPLPPI